MSTSAPLRLSSIKWGSDTTPYLFQTNNNGKPDIACLTGPVIIMARTSQRTRSTSTQLAFRSNPQTVQNKGHSTSHTTNLSLMALVEDRLPTAKAHIEFTKITTSNGKTLDTPRHNRWHHDGGREPGVVEKNLNLPGSSVEPNSKVTIEGTVHLEFISGRRGVSFLDVFNVPKQSTKLDNLTITLESIKRENNGAKVSVRLKGEYKGTLPGG